MRFHLGAIPEAPDFSPDASWKPLREPTPWMAQLLALPIGLGSFVAISALWFLITPLHDLPFDSPVIMVATLVIIIPIHELIHLVVHPHFGSSNKSITGFWPSRLLFYAHYDDELSRNRFIAILLAPLLVISFGPLIACALIGHTSGLIAFGSALNALLGCVDILGVGFLLFQIPADAKIRNLGWRTYWKEHEILIT